MDTIERREKRTHHGHAIKRLRQTLGIKQDALASDLGVSQQTISGYEHKPVIEEDMLEKIAKVLNVSVELIKELEEDPITVIFENNKLDNNSGSAYSYIAGDTVINNPVDKIVELFEKLLESEKEKIALLEKLLKEKK